MAVTAETPASSSRVRRASWRHSFATHLLQASFHISSVEEILGKREAFTTMIYVHVLNRAAAKNSLSLDEI